MVAAGSDKDRHNLIAFQHLPRCLLRSVLQLSELRKHSAIGAGRSSDGDSEDDRLQAATTKQHVRAALIALSGAKPMTSQFGLADRNVLSSLKHGCRSLVILVNACELPSGDLTMAECKMKMRIEAAAGTSRDMARCIAGGTKPTTSVVGTHCAHESKACSPISPNQMLVCLSCASVAPNIVTQAAAKVRGEAAYTSRLSIRYL